MKNLLFILFFSISTAFTLDIGFLSDINKPYLLMLKDCVNNEWIINIDDYNLRYNTISHGSLIKIFTIISKYNKYKNNNVDVSRNYRCQGFNAKDYSVCWLKKGLLIFQRKKNL